MPSAPSPPRGAALTWVPRAAVEGPRCGEAGRAAGGRAAPLLLEGAALRLRVPGAAGEEGRKEGGPPSGRGSRRDGTRGAPEPRAAPSLSSGGRSSQQSTLLTSTPPSPSAASPHAAAGTPQESPPPPSTHLSLRSTSLGFRLLQEEQKAALSPHLAAPRRAVPWVGAHLRSTLCATQHSTARSKAPVAVSTATNQAGGSQASSVLLTTSGSFRSVCRGRGEGPGGEPA